MEAAEARRGALAAIGRTPLFELAHIGREHGVIWVKAEFMQPGGSHKDRAALAAILGARRRGLLPPAAPVVEATSGNTGASLAFVAAVLGHPMIAVMPEGGGPERTQLLQSLGAEVITTPLVLGAPGQLTGADLAAAEHRAREVARERLGYYVDQFHNQEMHAAHKLGTGAEILESMDGTPDAFVACVGTGGMFGGVAAALKARNPNVLCAAVEPAGAAVLAGRSVVKSRHILRGAGYGAPPPHWNPALMDISIEVEDDEARAFKARLARLEGLHVGYTSAANVCAAVKLLAAGRLRRGARVVAILSDCGYKYPL